MPKPFSGKCNFQRTSAHFKNKLCSAHQKLLKVKSNLQKSAVRRWRKTDISFAKRIFLMSLKIVDFYFSEHSKRNEKHRKCHIHLSAAFSKFLILKFNMSLSFQKSWYKFYESDHKG